MPESEDVQGSLIEFIQKIKGTLDERNRELKDAREMKDGSLAGYITGRRDELQYILGEAYKDMYQAVQKEQYQKQNF